MVFIYRQSWELWVHLTSENLVQEPKNIYLLVCLYYIFDGGGEAQILACELVAFCLWSHGQHLQKTLIDGHGSQVHLRYHSMSFLNAAEEPVLLSLANACWDMECGWRGGNGCFPIWETEAGPGWINHFRAHVFSTNLRRQVRCCFSLCTSCCLAERAHSPQMRRYSTGTTFHAVKSCQMAESDLKNVHLMRVWQASGYTAAGQAARQRGKRKELETRQTDSVQDGETMGRGVSLADIKDLRMVDHWVTINSIQCRRMMGLVKL